MVDIILVLVSGVIACFSTLLGIWFKFYLDHKPIAEKQSLFPDPEECPIRSSNKENMITTTKSQCVEFDFSKGVNNGQEFVSIVYKFDRCGILSKYDQIDFDVVFESGNFNRLDFELQTPNKVVFVFNIELYPEDQNSPKRVEIPLKKYSEKYSANDLHNVNVLSFVVWHDSCDDPQHTKCHGKYRIQNLALRKK